MSNPQLENGYVRIARELVDNLCKYRLSGEEWQVLWVIIRKTWGWGKKSDPISLNQFRELTGIKHRHHVLRAINKLVEKGVTKKGNTKPATYSIVKTYREWRLLPKKVTAPKGVTKKGNRVLPKKVTKVLPKKVTPYIKDKKDTIQKKGTSSSFSRFKKPTLSELTDYIKGNAYNVDPEAFIDFYESKGWQIGKNTMKDWRAAVRTWNRKEGPKITPSQRQRENDPFTDQEKKDFLKRYKEKK